MFTVIGISLKRSKGNSQKLAGLMLVVVLGNIGMWIVEKLVPLNFEFLSVSYLMSEFVFFFVYWMLQDYIHLDDIPPTTVVISSDLDEETVMQLVQACPNLDLLTTKEQEVLGRIIAGQSRKQMAKELYVSENTVKTHVKHVYEKLGVSGREEILALASKK